MLISYPKLSYCKLARSPGVLGRFLLSSAHMLTSSHTHVEDELRCGGIDSHVPDRIFAAGAEIVMKRDRYRGQVLLFCSSLLVQKSLR